MTAKEQVLAEALGSTEEQAELALRAIESDGEPAMAELPQGGGTFEDGTPVPNWVALLGTSRNWSTCVRVRPTARPGGPGSAS